MKDPLEYTELELQQLSIEELRTLQAVSKSKEGLFKTEQMSLKLSINSLYGALANKYFPLFNESMACAITGNGRYFIRKLANYIEETLQNMHKSTKDYIIYSDTDSCYFHIEPFMEMYKTKNPNLSITKYVDWADNFENKVIQPCIRKCIADFSTELNAYNQDCIGAEREIIADAAVFTEKKKYYARVRDSEGTRYPEDEPYIKIMGLDVIKSTTSTWAKKYLKESIPHILDKTENDLRNWVTTIKQEFITVDLNDIAQVGGVESLEYKLTDKGLPIGARSALRHNLYIKENNLDNKISLIAAGDKTKRLYLQEPNKFNSNIIAFTNGTFVDEIDCVDYDTQFYKGFLRPLELMVKCLNYDLQKETESLDDW